MSTYRIFIVDDEATIREGLLMGLEQDDYELASFATAEEALAAMAASRPDLVLLDIGLPGMSGVEALLRMKELDAEVLVIMITAYEDIDTVIAAMRGGAYDYVVKPLRVEGLEVRIRNALDTIRLKKEVQALQEHSLREQFPYFIGESEVIQDVMGFVGKVARSPDTPVLICGETGTGKELFSAAIHYRSPNFKGPLVTVNCAAIPGELVESELFGYEKGAFSGANPEGKRGLVEEAAQGTLFLDEVGDLSPEAQAKLLRFLEEGEFYRVGGTSKVVVRTRVISATNRPLEEMIEKDQFRRDLFFRLGVVRITVPSLNDRRDDILPLAKHFLHEFAKKFSSPHTGFSDETLERLQEHHWTGNVRELRNMVERAVLVGESPQITVRDLGLDDPSASRAHLPHDDGGKRFEPLGPEGVDLASVQESLERWYIDQCRRHGRRQREPGGASCQHEPSHLPLPEEETSPGRLTSASAAEPPGCSV